MVWYVVVWYGVVWCGMGWYGMVWCGLVWFSVIWWFGVVWKIAVYQNRPLTRAPEIPYGAIGPELRCACDGIGVGWCGMLWYGAYSCRGMVWCGVVWCCVLCSGKFY